jgi:hypothetical protein
MEDVVVGGEAIVGMGECQPKERLRPPTSGQEDLALSFCALTATRHESPGFHPNPSWRFGRHSCCGVTQKKTPAAHENPKPCI